MLINYRIISWLTNFLSTKNLIFRFIFSSVLETAIKAYEKKKPTDLAADENSVISPEQRAANRFSLFKNKKTTDEIFDDLNECIPIISEAIHMKIYKWVKKMWLSINYLYV